LHQRQEEAPESRCPDLQLLYIYICNKHNAAV
jgi:hypothetical protein